MKGQSVFEKTGDPFSLAGKTAILTGHKGNLGKIFERTLADAGVRSIGIDLPTSDIRFFSRIEKMSAGLRRLDTIPDIIVNNAAIDHPPQEGVNFWTDYENIILTNLVGAINVTRAFLPDMIERGSGVIINIGSIQGNIGADWRNYPEGFEKPVGYNVSKAGLVQFTRSLATQYGQHGIRSVCISFAAVDSGKFTEPFASRFKKNLPLGRFISPDSLRATLRYACCCPELTGQQLIVDSGYLSW